MKRKQTHNIDDKFQTQTRFVLDVDKNIISMKKNERFLAPSF